MFLLWNENFVIRANFYVKLQKFFFLSKDEKGASIKSTLCIS